MHLLHVVGARPNFMKAAPVMRAFDKHRGARQTLVHTGQHYDAAMSDVFFEQLGLPRPDVCLHVGSGSHAVQTARIMTAFEQALVAHAPDLVLVYGDVNSTLAAALVCAKLGVPAGHVEAGLRSFDRSMPEEINRIVTDRLADLLFTPSRDGDENLRNEGVPRRRIHCVGNVMIDTLVRLLPRAERPPLPGLRDGYALVTLHRPSNVDDPAMLRRILAALVELSGECPLVFPVHPRTRQRIAAQGIDVPADGRFTLLEPVGYTEMLALERDARAVITDSGGVQEETTYLGVPCLTLRENTERPVTVVLGTNVLIGGDMDRLKVEFGAVLEGRAKIGRIPPLWDGRAGERIAEVVVGGAAEEPRWLLRAA
ncbi:MAG TPA: UDP-N-acetylglucosamine 2-epimerase (non-hydrolyzing) [Planctomycetaceae bacterium]|nr:UDP-N-acetylglucosamine 2-epimerase (non-hydrolyzing) [Planctomycetaceae bacterium]